VLIGHAFKLGEASSVVRRYFLVSTGDLIDLPSVGINDERLA